MPRHVTLAAASYCTSTYLHGPAYLISTRRRWELCYWAVAIAAAVAGCLFFSVLAVLQWVTEPLVLKISDDIISLDAITYPAVTVCVEQVHKIAGFLCLIMTQRACRRNLRRGILHPFSWTRLSLDATTTTEAAMTLHKQGPSFKSTQTRWMQW